MHTLYSHLFDRRKLMPAYKDHLKALKWRTLQYQRKIALVRLFCRALCGSLETLIFLLLSV